MSAPSYAPLFKRLCYQSEFSQWTKANLWLLKTSELAWLCRLMGVAYTGTKKEQIERLLDTLSLREILAEWGEDTSLTAIQAIAARYKLKELRELARRAGTYRWVSKYGVAAGLMKWRQDRRRLGQKAQREMQIQLWSPQLEMPFESVETPEALLPLRSQTVLCDVAGQSIHASATTVASYFSDVFASMSKGMKEENRKIFEKALVEGIESQWRDINQEHMSSWLEDIPPVKLTCWPRAGFLIADALEAAGETRLRGRQVGFITLNIFPWKIEALPNGV